MNIRLYINDNPVTLKPGEKVAYTSQVSDLAELRNYQAGFTRTFQAPKTDQNRKALGLADELNNSERAEYKIHNAKLWVDGSPLISSGTAIIKSVGEYFNISVFDGLFELFENLEGLTLHDISTLSNYDHVWDASTAGGAMANTGGHIYPIIQYGNLTTANNTIDIATSPAGFFIHTLITDLLADQGYTVAGDLASDTFYKSLVLPQSKGRFEHSDRYLAERGIDLSLQSAQNVSSFSVSAGTDVYINTVNLSPSGIYTATDSLTFDISGNITVEDFTENESGGTITMKLAIYKNRATTPVILASTDITANGTYSVSAASASLSAGETVELVILATYTISSGSVTSSFNIVSGSMFSGSIDRTIDIGETVTPEAYLPKLSQKNLVKAIGQMFGVIFDVDPSAKTLTFRQFKEVAQAIPNALDWSSKLARLPKWPNGQNYVEKTSKIGNYGQKTWLKFREDPNVLENYADAYFEIDDATLPAQRDAFVLPWAASISEEVTTHTELVAKIITSGANVVGETQQRIVYIDRNNNAVTLDDGTSTSNVNTNVPWGRFIDPNNTQNLGFTNSLKSEHYSEFEKMLQDAVKLRLLLNLKSADVANFDHFRPVYFSQFKAFFYINKIEDFVSGTLTEVEAIRIKQ